MDVERIIVKLAQRDVSTEIDMLALMYLQSSGSDLYLKLLNQNNVVKNPKKLKSPPSNYSVSDENSQKVA